MGIITIIWFLLKANRNVLISTHSKALVVKSEEVMVTTFLVTETGHIFSWKITFISSVIFDVLITCIQEIYRMELKKTWQINIKIH